MSEMVYNVLFVCHGNICRSPMAEFIFKALVRARGLEGSFHAESAAVSDEEYGSPIYPPARRCLAQHGIRFDTLKMARTVTPEDYDRFDLIVCMDHSNLQRLSRIIGRDTQGKVHLLMSFCGSAEDVVDPWYSNDFETAFQDILAGCEGILASVAV